MVNSYIMESASIKWSLLIILSVYQFKIFSD